MLFGLVAGTTSFALNDRFHYDTVATAATYTFALPMDIPTEFLGDGDGNPGQSLTAANVPVYFGRQTLLERTALVGASTTLAAASLERDRYVDVALLDAGLAIGDYAVLDNGVAGLEEYALIGFIDTALQRVWFRTPLRFAHTAGSSFQEATLSSRQEGVHYTLTASTGTITSIGGFGLGNAVVLSYRTDGAFPPPAARPPPARPHWSTRSDCPVRLDQHVNQQPDRHHTRNAAVRHRAARSAAGLVHRALHRTAQRAVARRDPAAGHRRRGRLPRARRG